MRPLFIPDEIKRSISTHLHTSAAKAVKAYLSGNEEEDALTGALGMALEIDNQVADIQGPEIGGRWRWSIRYTKLRGRGAKATEKLLGADGIFELNLNWPHSRHEKKCLLFQAKNRWDDSDKSVLEQCIKLSNWREAAALINYTPDDYEAFFIDDVIKAKGSRQQAGSGISLGSFLADQFLECLIGDTDLSYDARSRKLVWKSLKNGLVVTRFPIGHRFSINVNPPKRDEIFNIPHKEIPNEEIHNYRMDASEEDILSLSGPLVKDDISRAKKRLAQVYHPDKNENMDPLFQDIMKKRMQEANRAADGLYARIKRRSVN
jgi:hypothetical protein